MTFYSIDYFESAQLIYDLKQVPPRANVCVEARGAKRAWARWPPVGRKRMLNVVSDLRSRWRYGGNRRLSSIKYAGGAVGGGRGRGRIRRSCLNICGSRIVLPLSMSGMKTGRDIVMRRLLGAEEFNFGTAAWLAAVFARCFVCVTSTPARAWRRKDGRTALKLSRQAENVVASQWCGRGSVERCLQCWAIAL